MNSPDSFIHVILDTIRNAHWNHDRSPLVLSDAAVMSILPAHFYTTVLPISTTRNAWPILSLSLSCKPRLKLAHDHQPIPRTSFSPYHLAFDNPQSLPLLPSHTGSVLKTIALAGCRLRPSVLVQSSFGVESCGRMWRTRTTSLLGLEVLVPLPQTWGVADRRVGSIRLPLVVAMEVEDLEMSLGVGGARYLLISSILQSAVMSMLISLHDPLLVSAADLLCVTPADLSITL